MRTPCASRVQLTGDGERGLAHASLAAIISRAAGQVTPSPELHLGQATAESMMAAKSMVFCPVSRYAF